MLSSFIFGRYTLCSLLYQQTCSKALKGLIVFLHVVLRGNTGMGENLPKLPVVTGVPIGSSTAGGLTVMPVMLVVDQRFWDRPATPTRAKAAPAD